MIQDNAIIHGRTVGAWKQLAQEYRPAECGTPEELGDFIERYRQGRYDRTTSTRCAWRHAKEELEAEEREFLANAAGSQGIQA